MSDYLVEPNKKLFEVCQTRWNENKQANFFIGRIDFFWKHLCSTTSLVLRKWSYNFHSNCQSTLSTLIYCSLRFVTNDNRRKIGQNFSLTEKIDFFSKPLVFNNLLGVTEKILQSPKKMSEYFVDPYKLSREVCHTRQCGKKCAKNFPLLESLPFFYQIFVFNNLLGPKKIIF